MSAHSLGLRAALGALLTTTAERSHTTAVPPAPPPSPSGPKMNTPRAFEFSPVIRPPAALGGAAVGVPRPRAVRSYAAVLATGLDKLKV